MTYGELESKIIKVLEEPDSALVNIKPVLEEARKDYESIIALAEAKTKSETRIRDLQDTNMKLFMELSGKKVDDESGSEEDDELEGVDAIDAFINKLDSKEGE